MRGSKRGLDELKALQKAFEENRLKEEAARKRAAAARPPAGAARPAAGPRPAGPASGSPAAKSPAFVGAATPDDAALFRQAMGSVTPIRTDRVARQAVPAAPSDEQLRRRAWAMGGEAPAAPAASPEVSDEYVARLLTDDGTAFVRTGMAPDTLRKLRRGYWSVRAELDLHGMTLDAARAALATFLRESSQAGLRCVRVIHGQGHNSPGEPVLRDKVTRWLVQHSVVLAFAQGKEADGGAGAVRVLLHGVDEGA